MENVFQKLTSALADPTRFAIYQFVSARRDPVTVQDVADRFCIHPNVARLHLTKLEDVNLLKSEFDKRGKGGRPSRLYSLSEQVVSLQFPPRDYQLLATIAIESLISLGEAGEQAVVQMGRRMGVEAAKRAMAEHSLHREQLTMEQAIESIQRLVLAQGLHPEIELLENGCIRFRVYNCTFNDVAKRFPDKVCKMHNALMAGIFETYLGEIEWQEEGSMMSGGCSCNYTVIRMGTLRHNFSGTS